MVDAATPVSSPPLPLPLPPSIAVDARFQAFARAARAELDRIDAALPTLLVTDIDAVTDAGILAHLAWQWHVMGSEGWDAAQDDDARRALIKAAVELHRYKGTPWAVRTALNGALGLDVVLEEADSFRRADGHWAEYQIDPGRVLTTAETRSVIAVAPAWAPARAALVRVYHGHDLRAFRGDLSGADDRRMLYEDWSGVDVDGVRRSFGLTLSHVGTMPPPEVESAAEIESGFHVFQDRTLRYETGLLDTAPPSRLPSPGIDGDHVFATDFPDAPLHPVAALFLPVAAVIDDQSVYETLNCVGDGYAVRVAVGARPDYETVIDGRVLWTFVAIDRLAPATSGAPVVMVEAPAPVASDTVVEFGHRVGRGGPWGDPGSIFFEEAMAGRLPISAADVEVAFVSQPPTDAPWGAGPWLDQPWGRAAAGHLMEEVP